MKHSIIFLSAAAALVLAACTQEIVPQEQIVPEDNTPVVAGPTSFKVTFESDPDTKTVIGLNGDGKPQCFWENGDDISLYTSADGSTTVEGYKFTTTLSANSTSATFEFDDAKTFQKGNYFATYPFRADVRGVNYGTSPYRIAAVDVPKSQKLVAGTYDKKACPMTAFAPEGSTTLEFKNAAAMLKFRVSESNILGGQVIVDKADAISGRFRADLNTSTLIPNLCTYNQPYYNYIDFSIDGSTALSPGTDYYIVVRPTELTSDLKIYLNGNLVKVINKSLFPAIERNKIYNLGTLTTPATPLEKHLTFDFTISPLTGWPTTSGSHHGESRTYPLYGIDYSFILTDCGGASKCQTYWAKNDPGYRLALAAQYRYFGLPVISGYKLIQVICVNKQLSASDSTSKPKMGITHTITSSAAAAPDDHYVSGGEVQTWNTPTGGGTYTYDLIGTDDATQYYLYALAKGAVATLTLTYVPI